MHAPRYIYASTATRSRWGRSRRLRFSLLTIAAVLGVGVAELLRLTV